MRKDGGETRVQETGKDGMTETGAILAFERKRSKDAREKKLGFGGQNIFTLCAQFCSHKLVFGLKLELHVSHLFIESAATNLAVLS